MVKAASIESSPMSVCNEKSSVHRLALLAANTRKWSSLLQVYLATCISGQKQNIMGFDGEGYSTSMTEEQSLLQPKGRR